MKIPSFFTDSHIALAHGNGGRLMRELIEAIFARHLSNELLDTRVDAACLPFGMDSGEIMVTTDGFTVEPLEFPGGNIGSLAVHGTVNDLAVSGATPLYLTLSAFIEEGLEVALLDRVLASMAQACQDSHVKVVAGDTKVLRRGQGGGIYFAMTGIGLRPSHLRLGVDQIRPDDLILLSGSIGDHGTAVLLAREQFGLSGELQSDSASVLPITQALITIPGLRFMRDPTRGGVATVAHEIAAATNTTIRLKENPITIADPVRTVCAMLGYDPLYLASEGRVIAVLEPAGAEIALGRLQGLGYADAAIIGTVVCGRPQVVLETELGGERILPELEDDPLPRIC
ncbi:MAG: hydrogenase expression/formation protein HypE [Methylovulum sp.]|uniref:hydrogenase expression/formation protein HypE n=1 Tax=Methylovulum sp. TaxID=1916980 RepID=UPI0026070B3C|nr:hydrogenase expression/formation protein HypE [Methylovulum sp.]MDD2722417.1 hydrogenase expression/formation protein HypE [Methylovulum sp.]MDD5125612.1 hydrogenase expression/formation protein HypE [Methylovulum sp.]